MGFGAYALGSVGYSLFVIRDCPEAYYELTQEIDEAKAELRAKQVSVS